MPRQDKEMSTVAPGPRSEPPSEPPKRRVLIVEEDPAALLVCRQVVEKAGFVVEAVDSGIAAVIAARNERPEFIFVAPQLRDVPGREAMAWLRANPALSAVPIVALAKPATPDSIRRSIHDALALRSKG
jgi:CheY-like chemotaxis protein